jgi:hypothetical protein
MFKEYEVVYRAKVMVTSASEKAAMDRLHYLMSSVADGIDGLLVGEWQLQTLTKEKANEATDTTQED